MISLDEAAAGAHPPAEYAGLEFPNTLVWRRSAHPIEVLTGYAELAGWCRSVGLLPEREAALLLAEAERSPGEATLALARSVELREVLHGVFAAVARGVAADPAGLAHLSSVLAEGMARATVSAAGEGYRWGWPDEGALASPLWAIARSAVDLLVGGELDRVKQCPGPSCGWLFVDASRNRSRRWCASKLCGNRARVAAHYRRTRAAR